MGTFRHVWKIAHMGSIFGPFLPPNQAKIGQFIVFCLFSWKVSAGFTWNLINKLIGRCVYYRPQRPKFFGPFWASRWVKIEVFEYFVKSVLWIHINLALYAHWRNYQSFVQYGPQRPNFWAILGLKVSKNSSVWSLSLDVFTGLISVLLHMLITSSFRCVKNLWAPD